MRLGPFPVTWRYVCALVLGLLILIAAVASFQLVSARSHLLRGARELRTDTTAQGLTLILRDPSARARLELHLVRARREFAAAQRDLQIWSPLLRHLGWVPKVGGQVAAAAPVADAAFYSTSSALHLVQGLSAAWGDTEKDAAPASPFLVRLTPLLAREHAQFVAARADAGLAARALRVLRTRTGNATLDRATGQLQRDLPRLRQTSTWLALAPSLLGMGRPSHYLFAWENPAEIRATGGYIGAADLITLRKGQISTRFSGSLPLPHEITSVPVPLPEAVYTFEEFWIFADSNWSPSFPLSARLERWFYGEGTGLWAEGVVDFVDTGVADILRGTGSVYLPGYRRWVDAGNAYALAQQYINGRYEGPVHTGSTDTVRKQFFGAVMKAVLQRVQTLPLARWPALGAAVGRAIARREILLYDERPEVEAAIQAAGADGRMPGVSGDYLQIVDSNLSYNKINPYVAESASYDVTILPDLRLDATLHLHYHLSPSPATIEGQGPGYGFEGTKHDYRDFLRVFVPPGARLRRMSGLDPWAPQRAYGRTQLAGSFLLREGQSRSVTISYQLPANTLAPCDFQCYRLLVRRQPASELRLLPVTVHAGRGLSIALPHAPVRSQVASAIDLTHDGHLDLSLHGSSQPRITPLPPSPPGDPYVPYQSFRDPRHPL